MSSPPSEATETNDQETEEREQETVDNDTDEHTQETTTMLAAASVDDADDHDDSSNVDEQDEFHEDVNDVDDDEMELPPEVTARLDSLRELNSARTDIMDAYLKERAALERKYHGLCEPLYNKRAEIVRGEMDNEIAVEDITQQEQEPCRGIPQFWVTAMGHMEVLAALISEADVDCLEHLVDVKCDSDEDGGGFTLSFCFEPNDYFQNAVLTKRYEVPNLLTADEPILNHVKGCNIQWKQGRCLTYRVVKKKQRVKSGPNAGKVRTVNRKEKLESFFHFFEPPTMPSMSEMDEEEAERLEEAFDQDYDVAQAFRSHIIPKAVLWFTGEAIEDEMAAVMDDTEVLGGNVGEATSNNNPFPPAVPGAENPECQQS